MKRLLLVMYLLINSGPVYAEWVKVDMIEASQATVYAPSSIPRKGNLVKMWGLFDFKTERRLHGGARVLSHKNQYEYDCAEKRQRLLASMWFSGHMGSGKIVSRFSDKQPWQSVSPEGPEHSLWAAACTQS
jgi:hypothetical protein